MAGTDGKVERGATHVGSCIDIGSLFNKEWYDLVLVTRDSLVERSVAKNSSPVVESVSRSVSKRIIYKFLQKRRKKRRKIARSVVINMVD